MPCTDPETGQLIGSYELDLLSEDERKRFEAHVVQCDHCFQDLYRTAPVISIMKPGGRALPDRSAVSVRVASPRWRRWALLMGTAAAVILLVYVARTFGPSEPQERLRGNEDGSIVVYAPIGEVPKPTELDWKIVPPAASYEVTITTAEGEIIWKGTTQAPPLKLPGPVRERLEPRGSYIWQVEAFGADRQSWHSPKTTFTVWD